MNESMPQLADVIVHARGSRIRGVKAAHIESRPWIERFPVCPALGQYQLVHVGIMETMAPTRIVRTKQTTTYFLACFGGTLAIGGAYSAAERKPQRYSGKNSLPMFEQPIHLALAFTAAFWPR
jgi:hypothetical protein